jgi:hypothetical protein
MSDKDAAQLGKNWVSQTLVAMAKDQRVEIESITWQSPTNKRENLHSLIISGCGRCTLKQFHNKDLLDCLSSDKARTAMQLKLHSLVGFFCKR